MDAKDTQTRFTELASRYLTENIRLWQRYGDVLRQLSEGRTRAASLQSMQDIATRDGVEFISNVMQLNLNYYSTLLDMGLDFTNRVFGSTAQPQSQPLSSPAASAGVSAASTAPGPTFELEFSGRHGEMPSKSFVVANKKTEVAEVSFEITEFVGEDGGARFRAPVVFTPDPFVVQPGAEQVVECRLPIDARFVPGTRYMALVRVTGFPGMEIGLIVTPLAGDEAISVAPIAADAAPPAEQDSPAQDSASNAAPPASKKRRASTPRKVVAAPSRTKTGG